MVLVGLDRGLVFANVAFRDMRASSRPVIVSDGRLSNFDGRASRTVHAMVCDAAGGLTSCALVARDDSSGGVNPSSLALWSCAIGPADAELVAAFSIGRPLLKLVLKRQSVDASRLAPLRKIFDLTAAELRVVQLLADGLRPDEVAGQCGTSVSTVRTHLQTIYSKTGVRSQTQLVRVALMAALT
jgi:DNA-binding CsgD family transcriptional regulator